MQHKCRNKQLVFQQRQAIDWLILKNSELKDEIVKLQEEKIQWLEEKLAMERSQVAMELALNLRPGQQEEIVLTESVPDEIPQNIPQIPEQIEETQKKLPLSPEQKLVKKCWIKVSNVELLW